MIEIFVVGAHLTGMPLNKELLALGGELRRATKTAPDYRFYALPGTVPPKPGLIRSPGTLGPGIAGEVALSDTLQGLHIKPIWPNFCW